MAGLYVHIPFCARRCAYCDFYSQTDERLMEQYVAAVCSEIVQRAGELNGSLSTIYFGGGTPSQLPIEQVNRLFRTIESCFTIESNAEITFECNPDDLTADYISQLRTTPVNRLSIGIQSFNDDDLRNLARRHTASQAQEAVIQCFDLGFTNISIDLIYGLPRQTIEQWGENLRKAFALPITHLSAYHLTYEEGTAMHRRLLKGDIEEVDEEVSVAMFYLLRQESEQAGMVHYEISNFGLPDAFSQHNSAYWSGKHYLGVGASAHSFDGTRRSETLADVCEYVRLIESGKMPVERENLLERDKFNDYLITRLRTIWGISADEIGLFYGIEASKESIQVAQRFICSGDMTEKNSRLILTPQGMLRSDGIIANFFQ